MELKELLEIASQFKLEGEIATIKTLGEGFINDTFIIEMSGDSPKYILQKKNKNIFKNIPGMMDNILAVTNHLKSKIAAAGGDPFRETLTLIPLKEDEKKYYTIHSDEYWCVTLFIEDSITYQSADTLQLAEQGGRGIAKFQAMLSDFTAPLVDTLPGFHNIKFRFEQWDASLAADPKGRVAQVQDLILEIESRREQMMEFYKLIENGTIPRRITHNDTKISNILFDKNDNVLCVIDLDTVLSAPCLYDFGDSIRSYTNTGAEDDPNPENVSMNRDIYEAYLRGYLSEADQFLTDIEKEYLPFSAKYITFEQVLRFLMDYIDGDTYYKIKYPEHNLVRARAQLKLLKSIEESI